jgi:tetratricopeptide (TPR) repeat protein
VVAGTLACAYSIWQPLRAEQQVDRALDLAAEGKFPEALEAVEKAHDYDPLTPRPLTVGSSIHDAAGDQEAALKNLQTAVQDFPGDPQVWIQLAAYHLNSLNQPADALAIVAAALYLDPQSRAAQTVFFQATQLLNPTAAPPPTSTPAPVPPPAEPAPAPAPEAEEPPPAEEEPTVTTPAEPSPNSIGPAPSP